MKQVQDGIACITNMPRQIKRITGCFPEQLVWRSVEEVCQGIIFKILC